MRPTIGHERYKELSQAVSMISVALEETFGAGIMSVGATPNPIVECEEIAKAIYKLGGEHHGRHAQDHQR